MANMPQPIQPHSSAWIAQTWISFVVAVGITAMGIWFLPVDVWVKAFMGMGLLFTVGSTFSLSKTVRDQHEALSIKQRIDVHLDAGCDVVLVASPALVEESLRGMTGRSSNTMALAGLMGRGALGWDGLLADGRRDDVQARLGRVRESVVDAGATSGAINVGDVA